MDFHLQNLRTGEAHALNPHRTLIGSAEHAGVRTAERGPYLAALIVRYPSGWAVRGLSDDSTVTFNRQSLRATEMATPQPGDVLAVGEDRFRFVSPRTSSDVPPENNPLPTCCVSIRYPDGMEEMRIVDHDLLIGRLPVCHVHFSDKKLSRITALIAAHAGVWYAHAIAAKPITRNGMLVMNFVPLKNGDEIKIGPLSLGIEIRDRSHETPPPRSDTDSRFDSKVIARTETSGDSSETADPDAPPPQPTTQPPQVEPNLTEVHLAGQRLEFFLKAHAPVAPTSGGISGWFGAQRDRISRFWYDTPEVTAARGLRVAGKHVEAFHALDRAIRQRPDSPELLRELYRLYEAIGFLDLGFRPLRQIEKLSKARGKPDKWVLETLAKLCEQLGRNDKEMFDRAMYYWNKLEKMTGVSYARERAATMATRALRDGGFTGTSGEGI